MEVIAVHEDMLSFFHSFKNNECLQCARQFSTVYIQLLNCTCMLDYLSFSKREKICRDVQPAAHGPHAAQDGYECGPTRNCKFT